MKIKSINNAYPALFFSMMFWGLSFVWTRQLLEVFTPLLIIFFRLILSFFLLFSIASVSRKLQKIQKKDYLFLLFLSFTQPFLYFIFEGYGIKYTSASISSILIATIPLFTPIGAFFLFREKLTRMNIFGLFISFGGVSLVVLEFGNKFTFSWLGILMLFLAVITGTIYGLGLKKLTSNYNSITITTYQNLIGIILFFPLIFAFEWKNMMNFPKLITLDLAFSLFNLALFASSIAFVLFAYGISKIGPSKATAFSYSIPVFTLVFAYFVLDESITIVKLGGMIIVLFGLFLSQLKKIT
ncbi:MAG: DMT family transporter [Bacteroidales bacterium]|jgi:drug/metabolite transporter (DMT)-like permease|nr:DMT family transporter [Bacteroidales bacterium]